MAVTLLAVGRTILVLGLVVGLLVALARVAQRWQRWPGRATRDTAGAHVDVVSRRTVGKSAALLVVRVAGRTFLVGQSAQQLTLLSELDGDATASPEEPVGARADRAPTPRTAWGGGGSSPRAWDAFIEHLREKTVRR
ncbi:MAG: flagellar biosynthetic protein FliO [Acidimicrobiales bacterium]